MKEPAFFVCAPIDARGLLLPDNLIGTCQICREAVQYRPGGPERVESMAGQVCTMICMVCAVHDIDKLEADRAPRPGTTH